MNANERYYYQIHIDNEMEKLLKQMRIGQAIKEANQKAYDNMIECEIEEAIYGQD